MLSATNDTAKRGVFSSFRKDKKGVTAIEFAMVAPMLLFMMFAIIELSFYNYLRASTERIVNEVARLAMTGNKYDQKNTETRDVYFNRLLDEQLKKRTFAGVKITIKKELYQSIKQYRNGSAIQNVAGGNGSSNFIVMYEVKGDYKFFTPLLGLLENKIDSFSFLTTVFVKNEYF